MPKKRAQSSITEYKGTAEEFYEDLKGSNEQATIKDHNGRIVQVENTDFNKHTTGKYAKKGENNRVILPKRNEGKR